MLLNLVAELRAPGYPSPLGRSVPLGSFCMFGFGHWLSRPFQVLSILQVVSLASSIPEETFGICSRSILDKVFVSCSPSILDEPFVNCSLCITEYKFGTCLAGSSYFGKPLDLATYKFRVSGLISYVSCFISG